MACLVIPENHVFVVVLLYSDPNVTKHHVQDVSNVGGNGCPDLSQALVRNKVLAPDKVKDSCNKLNYHWNPRLVLRRQKFLSSVKLTHSPNSWDHDGDVLASNFRHSRVLMNGD